MKVYNFDRCRIGDKVASIYQLIYKYKRDEIFLIDPTFSTSESFPVRVFLNDYFDYIFEVNNIETGKELESKLGCESIDFHNLWVSSPSLKQDTGHKAIINLPHFITQISHSFQYTQQKKVKDFKCVVLNHPLTDAPYNKGRNVDLEQWRDMVSSLSADIQSPDVIFMEIPIDRSLNIIQIISLLSLGDIFWGCDTGFSHLYSLIYPERPMIVTYPDSSHDIRDYHHVKELHNYSSEWCSDPINSFNYEKFILKNNRFEYKPVYNSLKKLILEKLNSV